MDLSADEKMKSLNDFSRGMTVRVMSLQCDRLEQQRLAGMGLVPGSRLTILGKSYDGTVMVISGERKLLLDGRLCDSVVSREGFF